jgi:NADH-quinone oxidoreductase subunit G
MPKLTIDGQEIEVEAGTSVIQACERLGIEIPRFCYHERLAVAGNCRMCLVEMEKAPKPIASCAMPVSEGMVIKTNTPLVKKAREGVMEFLLINHPLDCPICDQGGECDLQDQAFFYGQGGSRYKEAKRAVEDKYMGPLIKTQMTRCIHCTRCVRFATDVAGVEELGALGRGEHMEIGTYVEKAVTSELSGNMIDLCPVGALTSKPYAFKARPWELRKTETIDALDAVGSNIRVDSRGEAVLRVLPRVNDEVNEEWISDKTRFAYDGLRNQRLDRPFVRVNGKLQPATWQEAFDAVAARFRATKPSRIGAIVGNLADTESALLLKELMHSLGSAHIDCREDGAKLSVEARQHYLFNTTIAGIDESDVCLLVGTNPRYEASIINARLRKRYLKGNFTVYNLGEAVELTYPVEQLGNDPALLAQIASGKHPLARILANARSPMMIVGMAALAREDGAAVLSTLGQIVQGCNIVREGWNGFNLLHTAAGRVGALDMGCTPAKGGRDIAGMVAGCRSGEIDTLYLLNADEIDMSLLGDAFVIYQGHHGDAGAHRADVVLPGAAYTEKDATYTNLEGRVQHTLRAVFPVGEAREDWKILRALSQHLGQPLPYDTLEQVRARMAEVHPAYQTVETVLLENWTPLTTVAGVDIRPEPFYQYVRNFYMTDPISRASRIMADCTASVSKYQVKAA